MSHGTLITGQGEPLDQSLADDLLSAPFFLHEVLVLHLQ